MSKVLRLDDRRWWMYALAAAVAFGALYLAFELGRFRSGFSVIDHRRDIAALTRRIDEERTAGEELRRQIAIAQTSGEIDRETYSQVESNLSNLQAKIQSQEEELVFYRGIVSPQDGVAGLRIQSLEVLPADGERRYSVRVVVVQAVVHSKKLAGQIKLQIEGMRDGQMVSLDGSQLAAGDGRYDMAYDFRYFQGLETELELPLGFEPQRINVEIWPGEAKAEKVYQSFDWSVTSAG
ncbi:MAG: DUF6776 family protein [Gammaproteobacteria bacterium]